MPRVTELEEVVRRAPFPLYGLVGALDDARWVARHDSLPWHVVLGHGDPYAEPERWVKVGVMLRDPGAVFGEFGSAAIDIPDYLAGMHGGAEGFPHPTETTWKETRLSLEGISERFELLGSDEHWIAYREQPVTCVFVHSRRVPTDAVELVLVAPGPYLRGSHELDN
jgi:hypothetical protein